MDKGGVAANDSPNRFLESSRRLLFPFTYPTATYPTDYEAGAEYKRQEEEDGD